MDVSLAWLSAGIGAGLTVIGGGIGIGLLSGPAMSATGRQPEASGDIRTTMIISAALVEGLSLFGLVINILLALK